MVSVPNSKIFYYRMIETPDIYFKVSWITYRIKLKPEYTRGIINLKDVNYQNCIFNELVIESLNTTPTHAFIRA